MNLISTTEDSRVLAGGQSLIPMMKLRIVSPKALIDINPIKELGSIKEENGIIKIGALATHDEIEHDKVIHTLVPLLAEAASLIGDQQIRNRGTIGGSIAQADPASDLAVALVACKAAIATVSPHSNRTIESVDFFKHAYTTSLSTDEIVREIRIPIPPTGTGTAYMKLAGTTGEWSVASVAVAISADGGVCRDAAVVLGSVTPAPRHASEAEKALIGKEIDDRLAEIAAGRALDGVEPGYGEELTPYRANVARVLVKRAIQKAWKRVSGSQ